MCRAIWIRRRSPSQSVPAHHRLWLEAAGRVRAQYTDDDARCRGHLVLASCLFSLYYDVGPQLVPKGPQRVVQPHGPPISGRKVPLLQRFPKGSVVLTDTFTDPRDLKISVYNPSRHSGSITQSAGRSPLEHQRPELGASELTFEAPLPLSPVANLSKRDQLSPASPGDTASS